MTTADNEPRKLERVTVNLIERAARSIRLSVRLTGMSKTDVLNRDAQLGAYFDWQLSRGTEFYMREPGQERMRIIFGLVAAGANEVDRALADEEVPAAGTG